MKRGYSISGGSTKIAALAGASVYTLRDYGYKPDYISGISAGGILSVPLALGMYDEITELATTFTYDDIFTIKPVNKKGNITLRAISRIISGKESLGTQDALVDTISDLIPKKLFEIYQKDGQYPVVILGMVEFTTGKRYYLNMKDVDYEVFLASVKATSSIPVFVESVEMPWPGYYYDGGVRDHIGSHYLMENYPMDEHISLYSRPADYDITETTWEPKNVYTVLQRTLDIMSVEISKNDELKEDVIAHDKNIQLRKIFMPYVLSDQTYEISPEKLKEWYKTGYDQAKKILNS